MDPTMREHEEHLKRSDILPSHYFHLASFTNIQQQVYHNEATTSETLEFTHMAKR